MKKLCVVVLLLISIFVINGCAYDEEYYLNLEVTQRTSLTTLQTKYDTLINKKEELKQEIQKYNKLNNENNEYIKELQEKLDKVDIELEDALNKIKLIEGNIITGSVQITQVSYNTNGWWFIKFKENEEASTGSGFIISKKDGYYYVMTNFHVVELHENKEDNDIYIYDYQNSEYKGTVLFISEKYDMALVRFKSNKNYHINILAEKDPEIGENIFVIGTPKGQLQSVSTGVVERYRKVSTDTYTTEYDCFETSAFSRQGNSGGVMLNEALQVAGITTWGLKNDSYVSYSHLGSPVTIIKQFLKENNFNI